ALGYAPGLWDIAAGADGNLWFAYTDGRIGRITTAGNVTAFPLPPQRYRVMSFFVSAGRDAVWFTATGPPAGMIGRVTLDGAVTLFQLPADVPGSGGVATGADGSAWFTEARVSRIGRFTPDGTLTEIQLAAGAEPGGIVAGADGGLWFTEGTAPGKIGRVGP